MSLALLGMLAEVAGFSPAFAEGGERPEAAIVRVRPLLVVLLDASLSVASSDLFFANASRRRVGLAIVRRAGDDTALAEWALRRDVPCLDVPSEPDQFRRVVEAGSACEWWRAGGERRKTPRAEHADDGTLIYVDRRGSRWRVYDRRAGDRRQTRDADDTLVAAAAETGETNQPARLFLDPAGMAWQYVLTGLDADAPTPIDLERQLARASRVEPPVEPLSE